MKEKILNVLINHISIIMKNILQIKASIIIYIKNKRRFLILKLNRFMKRTVIREK